MERLSRARGRRGRRHSAAVLVRLLCLIGIAAGAAGCDRGQPSTPRRVRLPVRVLADTSATQRLRVIPPADAGVWMERVSHTPPPVAPAAPLPVSSAPPLPEARPDTAIPETPKALEVDPGLKPPILRGAPELRLPPGSRGRAVELDVRVDEAGRVSHARWAGGDPDSALIAAARDCALSMRFYPALRVGRPVAVWCRQRFEFGGNR